MSRRLTQRNRQGRHRRSRRPDCQVHLRPTARSVRRTVHQDLQRDQETGKNILVIVDDIDRLHSDELLSVMKAVRLLGRFDGVHYLLSYDEQTLLGVLEQTDLAGNSRPRARDYLEKIVQYPFTLPPLQESHLADELRTHIGQVAQNHDLSTAPQNGGSMDAANYVFRTIPHRDQLTLRTLYRLFGQVDVLITLVGKSDINLIDATLVTALRLRHPELYRSLPKWRRDLLGGTSNAKYKITAKDWQKRITDTTGLTSETRYSDVQGLVTLFPRMEHTRRHDRTRAPRGLPCQRQQLLSSVLRVPHPHRRRATKPYASNLSTLPDGTWPSESIVLECITDASRNDLVRTKIGMNVTSSQMRRQRNAHPPRPRSPHTSIPREKVSDSTTGAWSSTRSSFAPSALQPRRPTQNRSSPTTAVPAV
ncbi:hypothetical protein GS449_26915 [Rhodococcus hoagii]|nr:hypothetical protein [Prescottella equi]